MRLKQQTLKGEISFSGKGLHTGLHVNMTVLPAEVNHGIKFCRVDLEGKPIVDAIADYVTDTSRGTTIEKGAAKVATIEHIMAALFGLGVDNALIEIDAPEVPIMDGSAREYAKQIELTGVKEQAADRVFFEIREKITYTNEEKGIEIAIYPDPEFSINVLIDYNSQVLGCQYANFKPTTAFAQEIAPCRTFVFLHELEFLFKHNLIKGGDMENAIVVVEHQPSQEELDRLSTLFNKPSVEKTSEGYLNNLQLRFSNEPARHKLLDLIGDFSLIGYPIVGRVVASRPGHMANTEFAKEIRKAAKKFFSKPVAPKCNLDDAPLFDINAIKKMLPHRPPFLLVDKVMSMTENSIVAVKNVTMNEPFFVGHFPEEPVMPGVLQIEAMAQAGGILALSSVPDPENYSTYFLKIDGVKFNRKVVPGDTLVFKLELIEPIRRGFVHMLAQGFVGETHAVEADLLALIQKNK